MRTAQDLTLELIAQSLKGKTFEDDTLIYSFERIEKGYFVFKSLPTPLGSTTEKKYLPDKLANLRVVE